MANIKSLLSSSEDVATSSKLPKVEFESPPVAFPANDGDLGNDPLVSHFLQQSLASERPDFGAPPAHASNNPMPYSRLLVNIPSAPSSAFRSLARPDHDGFSALKPQELNVSPCLQELNKENQSVGGVAVQPRKSVGKLLEDIKTLDNQINLMCDMRSRLMQELSSKVHSGGVQ